MISIVAPPVVRIQQLLLQNTGFQQYGFKYSLKGGEKQMKLSFKYKSKMNNKTIAIIEELSYHTTKLYNRANYNCREDKCLC